MIVTFVAVSVNGEPLVMTKGETELEMVPYVEGGELVMLWQKHREGLGNAVELTTGAHISSSGTLFLHLKSKYTHGGYPKQCSCAQEYGG